jgi:phosphate transport system permease protein
MQVRYIVDRVIRVLLFLCAFISIIVVLLIFYFTGREGWPAMEGVGLRQVLGEGFAAYSALGRPFRIQGEIDLREKLEEGLTSSASALQDETESALRKVDNDEELTADEQAEKRELIRKRYQIVADLRTKVETAMSEIESDVELENAVKAAMAQAVAEALELKLGTSVPEWLQGPAVNGIGLWAFLTGTVWRPDFDAFGIVPMIVGSTLATLGAVALGVPLALGCAIFLAEVAPEHVRSIVRPAVELLAGIPSVVYGLFGMVVLVPLVRRIPVMGNTGQGIFSASIVLAIMVLPTITNIAEDAIRAVPREYKEGSLALGATHFQTIINVMLPAARSGIIAAIILGVGRALGETMAMIMVIGNSIAVPKLLNDNPFTIFLSSARTLTGNIAVEIAYATGIQESALFATGVVLFILIIIVNSTARLLMRERRQKA